MTDTPDVPDHPVATAWAKWATGEYVSQVWPHVADGPEVVALSGYGPEVLRVAAIRSVRTRVAPELKLPLPTWLAACVAVAGGSASTPPAARKRATELVQRRRSSARHRGRTVLAFDLGTTEQALDVLQARATTGVQDETRLQLLPAKWRVPPAGSLSGAPVIEATRTEIAIVSLLANTDVNWQFSSTPAGHVFASWRDGYTREESERDYVSGLSVVIDTVAGVVERHRKGTGGRVFITSRHVECADCKRVVAWVNEPGARPTAFQRCSGLTRR